MHTTGGLPAPDAVVRIPLSGDIVYGEGINANGIAVSPSGQNLIIVQSNTGLLFTVDPATGVTARTGVVSVDGDALLPNGDGLPTTLAASRDQLYLPNARFGVDVTPETEYTAVAVTRP